MIDHIGFAVADFGKSRDFYTRALAPLGWSVLFEGEGWAMLGSEGRPQLWIGQVGEAAASPVHLAFQAADREAVRRFHAAALAAGGRDNGGPGVREQYHPNYYAAFAFDPDGHNVEAVCHMPGDASDQGDAG